MQRDYLLINHAHFLPALRNTLPAEGVTLSDSVDWEPSEQTLQHTMAGFVWFYDCLRFPVKVWKLKRRLARYGVPLVAWNRDAPHYLNRKAWRLDMLDRFRLLDIYATHTLIDTQHQFADTVLYFPNAADIDTYHAGPDPTSTLRAMREPEAYEWDVTFFGGMDGQHYKEDRARAEFFSALGDRLSAHGIRYCFREAEGMSVPDQLAFIRKSRINLNFGARCEYLAPVASGLPERCYGIPAAGGFLLCDKRTHARDDFTPGENWAEFDGLEDCVAKIEHWLSHFQEMRDLAERCHIHVMQHHTYTHRAHTLVSALQAWHAGERGRIK